MSDLASKLIDNLPKAELHLHIEGTLEPEMMLRLAKRNKISLPYKDVEDVRKAYEFDCLQDFLDLYYLGMSVLLTEQDFFDLTWAYLERVHQDGLTHVELFFDPQAHTDRGVSFETVLGGLTSALEQAQREMGISSKLIMCFLRHLPEEQAFDALECACKHKEHIFGVGLDSSEKGFPPPLFERVFAKAREEGFVPVAHLGEEGTAENVREGLDLLKVERVDHGNHALDDPALTQRLAEAQTPLTMCPISNWRLKGIPTLAHSPVKKAMDAGLLVTVNSDDPSYFGGYLNDNYRAVYEHLPLVEKDLVTLAQNSFKASFLSDQEKQIQLDAIDAIVEKHRHE
ncbi:adenosine deaminase [Cohaesibacter gelatinilyticus]|uniref:Adenine deaminase n=1 Tax=Cohaesibacter gelatinilyticus TaxID=372072 RepID=A0A285NCT7_9HYPH|nr:adenosine deaminase [Cohaesibacter gelatinilyticus]SNZ07239.1 adenosine deaminase [Cohaesibacter gelatinilyticus]